MNVSSEYMIDAVNDIISSIGEAPINTLENPTNVDVINAIRILRKHLRDLLSKGWWFNTEEAYKLNPDFFSKRIDWNSNIISLVGTDGTRYRKRGRYVYDIDNSTDVFENTIEVKAIMAMDFEDLPDAMRKYITAKAANEFQSNYLGDATLGEKLMRAEMMALADLNEAELDAEQPNMLDNPSVQQLKRR